ncbi:MAG: hypothetical protein PHX10_06370 [Gallionellaceae bacterium]|nr:hypothetical protein [Gallionellaceae bacterium]
MTGYMRVGGMLLLAAMAQTVRAEPGYRWEMNMEMNGMVMPGMGGGSQCLPVGRSQTPGMDSKCTVLESRQTGSTYHWKARCDGTVSTGDFTYLGDTAYKGTVSMDEGGEKMVMKMSGKRLDKCEYNAPRVAMPDMTATCDQAVRDLEPELVFAPKALCAKRKKDFCARLDGLSPESYARVADRAKIEQQNGLTPGAVRMEDVLASCGVKLADLQARQCRQAVSVKDCDFIRRYCPNDKAQCVSGRDFSGRGYSAAASAGGAAASPGAVMTNPLGEGMNKLKGLFGF